LFNSLERPDNHPFEQYRGDFLLRFLCRFLSGDAPLTRLRHTGAMPLDRRSLIAGTGAAALALPARAAPLSHYGLDAAQFGLHAGAPDDQSARLQRAIDEAARRRVPLALGPGVYRAGDVKLRAGAQILGVRGATKLALGRGAPLFSADGGEAVTLAGLVLDGSKQNVQRALVQINGVRDLQINECAIENSAGNALALHACAGRIENNTITQAGDNGLFCLDSRGLTIRGNMIRGCGNGGIRIWQSEKRHDGSIVAENRIEEIAARSGGNGQNGNGINLFRAAGALVRDNAVRSCAFSAIRGNAASNMQVLGNRCEDIGEVALYAEFGFEAAVISGNIVDGAELGVSVTNFDQGGRLAVVQGNLIRNLRARRPQGGPDPACIGIVVEADSAVTGNVIERAPAMGISVGTGRFLRDVTVSGNVVRETGIGIGVSVAPGAGHATITGNTIGEARQGAIVGMQWGKPVTGDLTKESTAHYPKLTVANNTIR
jgi:uncharacterized secreted repeat protein (TIGR03808 family)